MLPGRCDPGGKRHARAWRPVAERESGRDYILGFGVAFILDIFAMGFVVFFGMGFIAFDACIFEPDILEADGMGLVP
jgi:hypothetical protein